MARNTVYLSSICGRKHPVNEGRLDVKEAPPASADDLSQCDCQRNNANQASPRLPQTIMQTTLVVRMPSRIPRNGPMATATARAGSKEEALRLVGSGDVAVVELDYESGWQDAVELGRLGRAVGVRVEFRGHESIAVKSPAALVAGLARAKPSFRQRNLYCQFDLDLLPAGQLEQLEVKATKLGDYILGGHLLRDVDAVWSE